MEGVKALTLFARTGWERVGKFDLRTAALADRHYSRRKPGSGQFMPPGQTLILWRPCAVFGWWRPHPSSGIRGWGDQFDGWTCTIFRNESRALSSTLVLEAELELRERYDCGPGGLRTYVWVSRVRSENPGYCFQRAGWAKVGWSADGKKRQLQKPWHSLTG